MITNNIGTFAYQQQFFSGTRTSLAADLGPTESKTLSLHVLARTEPITHLAQDYQVSRKFLYQSAFGGPKPTKLWMKHSIPHRKTRMLSFIYPSPKTGYASS